MQIALKAPGPVLEVEIRERPNRFVVIVSHDGILKRAHINNTGHLEQFLISGRTGYGLAPLRPGKTDLRLFAIEDGGRAALIDTQLQMRAFEECLERGELPWLPGSMRYRRNASLGRSLIDYLIEGRDGPIYLEAKSAVLRKGRTALYPDCPTLRGQKHVRELTALARAGGKAVVLFIAALPGIGGFMPNEPADPALHLLLKQAAAAGVELRAIGLCFDPPSSCVMLYARDLEVDLGGTASP